MLDKEDAMVLNVGYRAILHVGFSIGSNIPCGPHRTRTLVQFPS